MGVVCRAVDEVLGREVALKVLRAYTDASAPELADLRTRMQREARAAARIRHSGVITVHDVIDEDGRPVIVMELVDGPSLDDAIAQGGALEPREIARIGARVMDALAAAHHVGVLHRDVKPGNVLLDGWGHRPGRSDSGGGRVVLTDFGIASIEAPGDGATTNITRSGELVGSLDYLPPERAQGQDPTPASDIWSLGMTLYAAVEGGGAPFRRTSVWSTLTAIVTEPLPEPQRAGPLAPVLHALMAKNPADRPSAAQARRLLEAVAEGRDTQVAPTPGTPYLPTATDLRAVTPPHPPQEIGQPGGGRQGVGHPGAAAQPPGAQAAAAAGAAPDGPVNAGVPPASWLSGPGPQGAPAPRQTPPAQHNAPGGEHNTPPAATPSSPSSRNSPHAHISPNSPSSPDFPANAPASGPLHDPPGVVSGPAVGSTGPRPYLGVPSERDTARLPARRRRRVALAVAAVLAVLATGGGVTYALVGGDPGGAVAEGGRHAPEPPESPSRAGRPSASAGTDDDKDAGKGKESPSPSASQQPSGDATSNDPKPGGAGGSSGEQDGGTDAGGTTGGADGGSSGGSDGGTGTSGGGSGGTGSGGSGGGDPSPSTSCVDIGGGRTNCDVWRTATSYTASFQQAGTLNMGTNYFYCQAKLGRRETYGKWTNVWWAKTDDDSGNSGVYISVVYITGGENDQPVPGLPTC
ncbi:serine/threonine-protein kinase [Streptomyces halobius]